MEATTVAAARTRCRLCEGDAVARFTKKILGRYDVSYYQCVQCGSLQTETPFWLDEAYQGSLNDLDVGAAHRNLQNLAATMTVANALRVSDVLDFGGGDGLLCRLLRDYGLNAFLSDRYGNASYARQFTKTGSFRPELVTAFEVLEHFARPSDDTRQLFGIGAEAVLVTTELYSNQSSDWWYLIPETGQHVFFYTERALAGLAKRYGYDLLRSRHFSIFVQPSRLSAARRNWLRLALRPRPLSARLALLSFQTPHGITRDSQLVREQSR